MKAHLAAVTLAVSLFACSADQPARREVAQPASRYAWAATDALARGGELYATHCAVCHGERGAGDGAAAAFLFPAARDFTRGSYRLVSTENGAPTDDDLLRTLRRGMPGSAMPAWNWMDDSDLRALAAYVRELSVQGLADSETSAALSQGRALPEAEAMAQARARMQPGDVVPVPEAPSDAGSLELGRWLYERRCAGCHGDDGSADRGYRWDETGDPTWPRDFTAGFLKGGASHRDLVWRIGVGLPGSAMPPNTFDRPREAAALAAYVSTLIPPGSEARFVHQRGRVVARPVQGELPTDPTDPAWQAALETRIVLAPLWWHRDSILEAFVGALHDGERIALRVRWADATAAHIALSELEPVDAAALQFSIAQDAPLFGMGSRAKPTDLWYWKSVRPNDLSGIFDLMEQPHALGEPFGVDVGGRPDAPLYRPGVEIEQNSAQVDALRTAGVGEPPDPRSEPSPMRAEPLWEDGSWRVVFVRALEPADPREVPLLPGTELNVALALWNGDAGDRLGRKSISIWQRLEIAP